MTANWWWNRSVAAGQISPRKHVENGGHKEYNSAALIVGITGIVGSSLAEMLLLPDTPGGPWKVYGVARRPRPTWLSDQRLNYIQCDISNSKETISKLSPLTDITHIFYVCWVGSEDCDLNGSMFRNVLRVVIPRAPNLQHVCLQTGIKYYLGVFDERYKQDPHDSPFTEDLPRLPIPNFYYDLEDILAEETKVKLGLTWSAHRPALVFGFSPCSMMNMVSTISVYATICKHENKPLVYPGSDFSWDCYYDVVDADLLAEQQIWASMEPKAKNQAFNCSNGDVFKWKHVWKILAEQFGLEMVGYRKGQKETSMAELMKGKEPVWEEIVKKHNLVPTKLNDIAAFWLADVVFYSDNRVSCMNKSKELGFLRFKDSTKSFLDSIEKMRAYRFIP